MVRISEFQSTYPRRVRRQMNFMLVRNRPISIHVPTKGTTISPRVMTKKMIISIHVPTKGTTLEATEIPTFRTISIHVPTKGTTIYLQISTTQQHKFQSTYPRRVRPYSRPPVCDTVTNFNPRTHEGYDSKNIQ